MSEHLEDFTKEWGLDKLPSYIGSLAGPLFHLSADRRPRVTPVYTCHGVAVGAFSELGIGLDGEFKGAAIVTASLAQGVLTVARHHTSPLAQGLSLPCARNEINTDNIVRHTWEGRQPYPAKKVSFASPASYVQSDVVEDLRYLAAAPPELDAFRPAENGGNRYVHQALSQFASGHTMEPALHAAYRDMTRTPES